jgi:hypothetical protein
MGMLTNLIDNLFEASWDRAQKKRREIGLGATLVASPDRPGTNTVRHLTIKDAMNGQYIEFVRHKYNPKGADDYENVVYIVREDETLVDAISTVLVLMNKEV